MRFLSMRQVQPGMKMARPIFTEDGKVLLGAGVVLTERLIKGLRTAGVVAVYIDDPNTQDIQVEDLIRPETRLMAVETIAKTFKQITNTNKLARRISVKDMGMHFQKVFHAILDDLMETREIIVHLNNLSNQSGAMYHHAINVGVLATAVGMSLGYNRAQLTELGIGAMLHDIGKLRLPKELLEKKERWTEEEYELAKSHTVEGFEILRRQHEISLLSAHVALQHHERLDGSGYPQGLSGKEIHEYAQITAICDVYDSLSTPRPWRQPYMPQDVLEYLMGTGGYLFEHHLIDAFRKHIAIFPLGCSVVLNTGETGVVCRVHSEYTHRPVVRVLMDGRGNPIPTPYEIDLRNELTMHIVGFEDEMLFSTDLLQRSST